MLLKVYWWQADPHIQTCRFYKIPLAGNTEKTEQGKIGTVKVKLNIDFREILGESKGPGGQIYLHFHILVSHSNSRKYLCVWYF